MCDERVKLFWQFIRAVNADRLQNSALSYQRREYTREAYAKHWRECAECQAEQNARRSGGPNPGLTLAEIEAI